MKEKLRDQDSMFETSKDNAIEDLGNRIIEKQRELDALLNELYGIDEKAGESITTILKEETYK